MLCLQYIDTYVAVLYYSGVMFTGQREGDLGSVGTSTSSLQWEITVQQVAKSPQLDVSEELGKGDSEYSLPDMGTTGSSVRQSGGAQDALWAEDDSTYSLGSEDVDNIVNTITTTTTRVSTTTQRTAVRTVEKDEVDVFISRDEVAEAETLINSEWKNISGGDLWSQESPVRSRASSEDDGGAHGDGEGDMSLDELLGTIRGAIAFSSSPSGSPGGDSETSPEMSRAKQASPLFAPSVMHTEEVKRKKSPPDNSPVAPSSPAADKDDGGNSSYSLSDLLTSRRSPSAYTPQTGNRSTRPSDVPVSSSAHTTAHDRGRSTASLLSTPTSMSSSDSISFDHTGSIGAAGNVSGEDHAAAYEQMFEFSIDSTVDSVSNTSVKNVVDGSSATQSSDHPLDLNTTLLSSSSSGCKRNSSGSSSSDISLSAMTSSIIRKAQTVDAFEVRSRVHTAATPTTARWGRDEWLEEPPPPPLSPPPSALNSTPRDAPDQITRPADATPLSFQHRRHISPSSPFSSSSSSSRDSSVLILGAQVTQSTARPSTEAAGRSPAPTGKSDLSFEVKYGLQNLSSLLEDEDEELEVGSSFAVHVGQRTHSSASSPAAANSRDVEAVDYMHLRDELSKSPVIDFMSSPSASPRSSSSSTLLPITFGGGALTSRDVAAVASTSRSSRQERDAAGEWWRGDPHMSFTSDLSDGTTFALLDAEVVPAENEVGAIRGPVNVQGEGIASDSEVSIAAYARSHIRADITSARDFLAQRGLISQRHDIESKSPSTSTSSSAVMISGGQISGVGAAIKASNAEHSARAVSGDVLLGLDVFSSESSIGEQSHRSYAGDNSSDGDSSDFDVVVQTTSRQSVLTSTNVSHTYRQVREEHSSVSSATAAIPGDRGDRTPGSLTSMTLRTDGTADSYTPRGANDSSLDFLLGIDDDNSLGSSHNT